MEGVGSKVKGQLLQRLVSEPWKSSLSGQRDHDGQVSVANEERWQRKAGEYGHVNTWELDQFAALVQNIHDCHTTFLSNFHCSKMPIQWVSSTMGFLRCPGFRKKFCLNLYK